MEKLDAIKMLGNSVRDKVTNFEGIVTSISFDLYGCIQALVNPGMDNDGKLQEQCWLDIGRLEVVLKEPVMNNPFTEETISIDKGPENKPLTFKKY